MNENGTEPNGWELLRAINRIESTVSTMSAGFVSLGVYNTLVETVRQDRERHEARVAEFAASLKTEEKSRMDGDERIKSVAEDVRKSKQQNLLTVVLAGVAVFATIFGGAIKQALGLP